MPSKTKTTPVVAEKPVVATPSSSQIGVSNSNLDPSQALKAFRALSAHVARRSSTTSPSTTLPLSGPSGNLRDASTTVYVQLTLNHLSPTSHVKPVRINVPHALHTPGEVSVGLLVKDPQREVKDLLVERGIKSVSRVVGVAKLKGKFKPYDARRALVQDHDLFLADSRIVPNLPNLCGKVFFDAKKNPITVDLTKKGDKLKAELESAISATTWLQNKGSCSTIKLGYLHKHSEEQLKDNLMAVLPAVLSKVKGGWENVHNIDVKTGNSAALPVWSKKLGVKTHVTPSAATPTKRAREDKEEQEEATPVKKAKSPVKKVVEEEKVKSPSPRKTRSKAAKLSQEVDATPVKGTPNKVPSSASRSARKAK